MTEKWQSGTHAAVRITAVTHDGVLIATIGDSRMWVPFSALHPIPSPDIAAANARVAEAADAWVETDAGPGAYSVISALLAAISARRALLAPPKPKDPVAELLRLAKTVVDPKQCWSAGSVRAEWASAIAAVEAARAGEGGA